MRVGASVGLPGDEHEGGGALYRLTPDLDVAKVLEVRRDYRESYADELAGLIWDSADTLDHPLAAHATA